MAVKEFYYYIDKHIVYFKPIRHRKQHPKVQRKTSGFT